MEKEIVVGEGEDPFYSQPDEEEYTAPAYGHGPSMDHWYQRFMLVTWPTPMSVYVTCEVDVSGALDLLEDTFKFTDAKFPAQLHQVVCFFVKERSLRQWGSTGVFLNDLLITRLLDLCTRIGALKDVLHVFSNWHMLLAVLGSAMRRGMLRSRLRLRKPCLLLLKRLGGNWCPCVSLA